MPPKKQSKKSCGLNCLSKQSSSKRPSKIKSDSGKMKPLVKNYSEQTPYIPAMETRSSPRVVRPLSLQTKLQQYNYLRSNNPTLPWYQTPEDKYERGMLLPEDRELVRQKRKETESGKLLKQRWDDLLESGEKDLPENAVDSYGGGSRSMKRRSKRAKNKREKKKAAAKREKTSKETALKRQIESVTSPPPEEQTDDPIEEDLTEQDYDDMVDDFFAVDSDEDVGTIAGQNAEEWEFEERPGTGYGSRVGVGNRFTVGSDSDEGDLQDYTSDDEWGGGGRRMSKSRSKRTGVTRSNRTSTRSKRNGMSRKKRAVTRKKRAVTRKKRAVTRKINGKIRSKRAVTRSKRAVTRKIRRSNRR
jgi:hypothetical protein